MINPEISVIISTYNSVEWLRKSLIGFENQEYKNFEILIADDGSSKDTCNFIEEFSENSQFKISHVWHEDNGFQKTKILNKALLSCRAEYIVMTDGDCIPRKDFLTTHFHQRQKGYFLSGGYCKLPLDLSEKISQDDIKQQRCFDIEWNRKNTAVNMNNKKLSTGKITCKILNKITPTNASWNGHNSSGWKSDIMKVNGFDERMQYGGEDREMGERLFNLGINSKQIRYSAICVHLDHERGYVNEEALEFNRKIREKTRKEKMIFTPHGITKKVELITDLI